MVQLDTARSVGVSVLALIFSTTLISLIYRVTAVSCQLSLIINSFVNKANQESDFFQGISDCLENHQEAFAVAHFPEFDIR